VSMLKTAPQPEPRPIAFIDLKVQRARLGKAVDEAVLRVVNHGRYIMGPEVGELEQALAGFCGAGHAIGCSSGTDALLLALMAWDVGPGDAVFVPAFTFAASAEVVALLGATPVFTDVRRDTFNLDIDSLKTAISHATDLGLRPRVIMPVGLFGQPADFDAIAQVASEHDLLVLDDAAQSFGASYKGRKVGTLGDATATSFFPAKPLGCYGDGGAVFTDDEAMAERMRSIRVHGKGEHKYDNARIGLNARLDTIQAAILLEKLKIFPDELEARQTVAARYHAGLEGAVQTPNVIDGATSAWAQYTIVTDRRDELAAALKDAGIPSVVYYPLPLSAQTAYRDFPTAPDGVPNADYLSDHVLSLPMHPYLEEEAQAEIIGAIVANGSSPA